MAGVARVEECACTVYLSALPLFVSNVVVFEFYCLVLMIIVELFGLPSFPFLLHQHQVFVINS
jgi:hypothetical protein